METRKGEGTGQEHHGYLRSWIRKGEDQVKSPARYDR